MRVVAAEVVKKYRDVVHNVALAIALIMRGSNVEAGDIIVVNDFAIVADGRVEGAVPTAADEAYDRIVMVCLLMTGQGPHFAVYFEVFDDLSLSLDVLVKELVY